MAAMPCLPGSPDKSTPLMKAMPFDPACRRCARLSTYLDEVRVRWPDYHAAPVPAFGEPRPRLLIVGLAPGLHGANATGRPFTGDHAGILLYETLHRYGFSSQTESQRNDALRLKNCRITNAVKCVPPQNRPLGDEIGTCNSYLRCELEQLPAKAVVLALGGIAHRAVLKARDLKQKAYPFGHNNLHALPGGLRLLDSYHCSRYNTQTRRLTTAMFRRVMARARRLVDGQ